MKAVWDPLTRNKQTSRVLEGQAGASGKILAPPYPLPCDLSLEPGNLPPFLESTGQEKANSRDLNRQLHLYSFQKASLTVERLRSICGCAGSCLGVHTCERGFGMNEQR